MNAETTIYNLKGQAQRLQTGLTAIGKAVTRTQALDLVAQMQGKRDWKELSGLLHAAESTPLQVPHAPPAQKALQTSLAEQWLKRLFYVLRLSGKNEEDLDDLVHDIIGGEEASSINNQGLDSQLSALLDAFNFDRKALVQRLEEELERPLAMPEGSGTQAVIDASLMICYGFPEETEHQFDAFDWALQATAEDLAAVVRGRYRNCDATDEIGLWMEKCAPNLEERAHVHQLLEGMRAIVTIKPDRTGITLDVDEDMFSMFVWLRHHYDGYPFEESILDQLGIEED